MKKTDRIKLDFTRNWKFPGKERLSNWLKPSPQLKAKLQNAIVWLTDEDIAIYTNADSYIEWSIYTGGTYENEIGKLIRVSLNNGAIALDIGANIGLQSIRMSQAVGNNGHVYAFEPLNFLQEKFAKNVGLNNAANITLLPYALSDSESEAYFQVDSTVWNQGCFNINETSTGNEEQKVTIKIGDNLEEIKILQRLDLIKIDVEGFEFHVLRGLQQTISKFKPRIIFEYDSNYWLSNNQDITECYNFLKDLSYSIYQITSAGCEAITTAQDIESGNIYCLQQ